MLVLVPCLSCRVATPAGEDATSLSCQSCGTALPPPAEAAWSMLRDGAQFGPYRIAELADWLAEGRLLPKDSIWYQGASLRQDVDQLPRFGPDPSATQPTPEPVPVEPAMSVAQAAAEAPAPEPEPAEPAAAEALAPAPAAADANGGDTQPVFRVRIPCVGCRHTMPAVDDITAVTCPGCGASLPPPAQAAWFLLRDGAQYGPYTIAQLKDWVVEGRTLPQDEVWYQGAAMRRKLNQLTRFGPVPELPDYEVHTNPDGSETVTLRHQAYPAQPVFISHALADSRFAAVFAHELSHHGLKAWYAERDAASDQDYWAQVDQALEAAGALVVVISPALAYAPNVAAEVERALRSGKPVFGLHISSEPGRQHGLGEIMMYSKAYGPEAGKQTYMLLFLLADIYGISPNDARPTRFALNLDYPGEGGKEPEYSLPPGPVPSYPAPPGTAQPEGTVAPAVAEEQPAPEPAPFEAEPASEPEPVASGIPPLAEEPAPVEAEPPSGPEPTQPEPAPAEAQPRLIVHIPCLACRAATPVAQDSAAASCQGCGTALPAPADAAWFMLRDGGQFGPYTTGQLAGYIAEGRILPQDSVWYQGASVRLDVNQLPPFGEVEEQSAPAPVQTAAPSEPAAPPPATAAASLPADGSDWDSVKVQPGETKLGSWIVGLQTSWRDVAGSLTVTDRRVLFKPTIAGQTIVGVLISQTKQYKDSNTLVLDRDLIANVQSHKRMLNTYITLTTVDGQTIGFVRGVVSSEPILAALQPR